MDANGNSILNLLEKQSRTSGGTKSAAPDADEDQEYVAFANGRVGARPQLVLIFHKADGSATALSYAHLYSVTADDPATGFVAEFTQTKVTIKGRNLEPLFRFVCQHRAWEVNEAQRNQALEASAENSVVERIEFADERAD